MGGDWRPPKRERRRKTPRPPCTHSEAAGVHQSPPAASRGVSPPEPSRAASLNRPASLQTRRRECVWLQPLNRWSTAAWAETDGSALGPADPFGTPWPLCPGEGSSVFCFCPSRMLQQVCAHVCACVCVWLLEVGAQTQLERSRLLPASAKAPRLGSTWLLGGVLVRARQHLAGLLLGGPL